MGWIIVGIVVAVALAISMAYDHRARRRGEQVRGAGSMTSAAVSNHLDNNAMNEVLKGMTGVPIGSVDALKAPQRDFSGNGPDPESR